MIDITYFGSKLKIYEGHWLDIYVLPFFPFMWGHMIYITYQNNIIFFLYHTVSSYS